MPRPKKSSKASTVAHAVEGLVHAITGLVDTLSGAAQDAKSVGKAAKEVKVAVAGKKQRGPGKGNPKLKAALKRYWAKMKGKARHSRIAKMLAGRGLKSKAATKRASRKPKAKGVPKTKPAAGPKASGGWAAMTSEQKAARIARMQAGRAKVAQG